MYLKYSETLVASCLLLPPSSSWSKRNLDWSLSSLSCSVAAWTFLAHSHGNYSTLCLCSLHFLTVAPFEWLCAKLKQAFFLLLYLPLSPPHLPGRHHNQQHFISCLLLKGEIQILSTSPFTWFSHIFTTFFFPFKGPIFLYSGLHTHWFSQTQTTSCLLCTDKSPLLAGTQSELLLHKPLPFPSNIRTHIIRQTVWLMAGCQVSNLVHEPTHSY